MPTPFAGSRSYAQPSSFYAYARVQLPLPPPIHAAIDFILLIITYT